MFLYYISRAKSNIASNIDCGVTLQITLSCLKTQGVCKNDLWPYEPYKYCEKPPEECFEDAQLQTIKKYTSIPIHTYSFKQVLSQGIPVIVAFHIYSSYYNQAKITGDVEYPESHEFLVAPSHSVILVGYNDESQRFIFRNSSGIKWGKEGYGSIPYEYLANPRLCLEAYMISS